MENEIEDTCLPYGEFVKCVQGIIADVRYFTLQTFGHIYFT